MVDFGFTHTINDDDEETSEQCCVVSCTEPATVESPPAPGLRLRYCTGHWEEKKGQFPDLERVDDG